MFKNFNLASIISIIIIGLFVGVVFVYADWSAPPFSPPTCPSSEPSCNTPINVGGVTQTKSGSLTLLEGLTTRWLTSMNDTYLAVDSGNVGIGTASPQAKLDVNGTLKVEGVILDHVTGSNPTCPAGTGGFLTREWLSRGCSGGGSGCSIFDPNFCTTPSVWSISPPECSYCSFGNMRICTANSWSEAVCLGN